MLDHDDQALRPISHPHTCSSDPNTFGHLGKELTFDVVDVADKGSEFSLFDHGFTYVKHATALTEEDFEDMPSANEKYYAEIAELVKKVYV